MIDEGVLALISCGLTAAAFVYAAVRLFRKGKPLYFQLIAAAVGCSLLSALNRLAAVFCGSFDALATAAPLAVIGAVLFLLSANYDQLDGLVDGGMARLRVKLAACIAPLLLAVSGAVIVTLCTGDILMRIVTALVLFPMLPASYLNLKHLLLPVDEVGFLRATRGTNLCSLGYYIAVHAAMLLSPAGVGVLSGAPCLLLTAATLALAISAERGSEAWLALISAFS